MNKAFINSGLFQVYIIVGLLSTIAITIITDSLFFGVFIGPWGGTFTAIFVNEVTEGFTIPGIQLVEIEGETRD